MSLFEINVSSPKTFKKNISSVVYLVIVVALIVIAIMGLLWLVRP
ncbi:MAG: hypothetical protein WCW31_01890 [Patescibacteria group bacterium]|jgi:hypothetical protein